MNVEDDGLREIAGYVRIDGHWHVLCAEPGCDGKTTMPGHKGWVVRRNPGRTSQFFCPDHRPR